jgi:di/tricarboxylate transporter
MEIASLSLVALVVVVIISCINQRLNPGILALLAAVSIGLFFGKMSIGSIVSFFPSSLFVLLISMSLVFGVAQVNGTLEKLTQRAVHLIKGQFLLLPILIFSLAFSLSALGPGNIVATAILAPMAMALAKKHRISEILIAIMLCTGANAGAFSPFAPTGVVTIGLLEQIAVSTSLIWTVFIASAVLQSTSALFAYFVFLVRAKKRGHNLAVKQEVQVIEKPEAFTAQQKLTLLLITILLTGVLVVKLPLIFMALLVAVGMFALNLAEEDKVIQTIPWGTIIMVCGIAVLIGLMEKTGGLELATNFIVTVTSADLISGALAFVSGLVSAYSSSSGVVLPAFLPLIPGLAVKMSIVDIVPMIIAVAVGSHMVDVSPLSTLGALSIAAVEKKITRDRMFKYLLIWGMAMSVVAGILAFVFLDLLN